jgi:DMSO/TMAO reductase YedYZ heme-binding membrane subunit
MELITKPNFRLLVKIAIFSTIAVLIYSITNNQLSSGKILGYASAWVFLLTIIPGIVKRLQLKNPIIANTSGYLNYTRQQLGILMFILAFSHYILSAVLSIIKPIYDAGGKPELTVGFAFGLLALLLSLPLALTSNSWIKIRMKTWWKKLHSLTYLILWLIFGHVAFNGVPQNKISLFAVVFAVFGVLQIYSLIKVRTVTKA